MAKHYPAVHRGDEFNCLHCGVYAAQRWTQFFWHLGKTTSGLSRNDDWDICTCRHCDGNSYWYQGKLLVPSIATVVPAHELFPAAARGDYEEAREIFARSPKAAGALLRLCLQKLLIELGQKGKNINDDIGALVQAGLPVFVQQALDYCRVIGNNAVHPLEINLDETPETAIVLFEMLNVIVDYQIAQPQRIAEYYSNLPDGAKAAIEKRDGIAAKSGGQTTVEPAAATGSPK